MIGEAKGKTSGVGLDVDTLYGQLLRRMQDVDGKHRYAVIVPTAAVPAALRVPEHVRRALNIYVYEVDDSDEGCTRGRQVRKPLAKPVSERAAPARQVS